MYRVHEAYRERLLPSMTLYRVTVRSSQGPLSKELIRSFEDVVTATLRAWLKNYRDW
jgi:hypothetical protein